LLGPVSGGFRGGVNKAENLRHLLANTGKAELRMDGVEALESSDVRVEGVSAEELGDLANVTEIVKGPFVHEFVDGYFADRGVVGGAGACGSGHVAEEGKGAVAFVAEIAEVFAGFALGVASFAVGGFLIVVGEVSGVALEHVFDAFAEAGDFGVGEVGKDFGDGPAVGGRFPMELLVGGGVKDFFDDDGSLLENADAGEAVGEIIGGHG
jgi:hypothetical protein